MYHYLYSLLLSVEIWSPGLVGGMSESRMRYLKNVSLLVFTTDLSMEIWSPGLVGGTSESRMRYLKMYHLLSWTIYKWAEIWSPGLIGKSSPPSNPCSSSWGMDFSLFLFPHLPFGFPVFQAGSCSLNSYIFITGKIIIIWTHPSQMSYLPWALATNSFHFTAAACPSGVSMNCSAIETQKDEPLGCLLVWYESSEYSLEFLATPKTTYSFPSKKAVFCIWKIYELFIRNQ